MIIPEFLKDGDWIGVFAPSAGIVEETDLRRFDNARRRLESMGHRTVALPSTFMCDADGRSSPAEQRVAEYGELLRDPDVRAIFAISGGDYECEMLPLMDWDAVEADPKWFQGYSDNTVLLFKITAEHDIATVYSGNYNDFGMEPLHRSISEGLEFLEGRRSSQDSFERHADGFIDRVTGLEPFPEDSPTVWRSDSGDVAFTGRLIGGCMDVIEWFLRKGTADAKGFVDRYREDGIAWYLETFDMDESRVCWTLKEMERRGWLEGCTGMVFGRPLFYSGPMEYSEAVESALPSKGFPILFDADVGHKAPRMTFVNGALVTFRFKDGGCTISYDFSRSR